MHDAPSPSPPPSTPATAFTRWSPRAAVRSSDGGDVVIERAWGGPLPLVTIGFAALFFGAPFALRAGVEQILAGAYLLGALEVAYAGAWSYLVLAVALNKTRVSLRNGWLERVRGPLPWPDARLVVHRGGIVNIVRDARRTVDGDNREKSVDVRLRVKDKDGYLHTLIGGLNESDAAFVEGRIESALGIVDDPSLNTESVVAADD